MGAYGMRKAMGVSTPNVTKTNAHNLNSSSYKEDNIIAAMFGSEAGLLMDESQEGSDADM